MSEVTGPKQTMRHRGRLWIVLILLGLVTVVGLIGFSGRKQPRSSEGRQATGLRRTAEDSLNKGRSDSPTADPVDTLDDLAADALVPVNRIENAVAARRHFGARCSKKCRRSGIDDGRR